MALRQQPRHAPARPLRRAARHHLERFSFGGPNDSFNEREQKTFSFADNVTCIRGDHTLRFGGEFKRHSYDTSLPEEQATEFEKFDNFTQFLRGVATEADTQFGITEKSFRFRDLSGLRRRRLEGHAQADAEPRRALGVVRLAGGEERPHRQLRLRRCVTRLRQPAATASSFPANAQTTGFAAVDAAIAATASAGNKHTLNGQDLNNFAPRIGFAYSPFENSRMVIRGGYGIFFDRPSAAFINTIFSNYPFLREVEVTVPGSAVPITTAFSQQDPNFPFNSYLPIRIVRTAGAGGTYQHPRRHQRHARRRRRAQPDRPGDGQPTRGNIAETFEFRAIDRNLKTPFVQQWNVGVQYEVTKNLLFEARYVGTKGDKLLAGHLLRTRLRPERPLDARLTSSSASTRLTSPPGAPTARSTPARPRVSAGRGRAFGFANSALGRAARLQPRRTPRGARHQLRGALALPRLRRAGGASCSATTPTPSTTPASSA